MSTQVKGCEFYPVNRQFFWGWMKCGHMLGHPIVFKHVQKGGFACIVKTQEQQFPRLPPQA